MENKKISLSLKKSIQKNGLITLLSYLGVTTTFNVFLQVYSISDEPFVFLFFAIVALILLFIKKIWLQVLLLLGSLLVGYHHFFSYNLRIGWEWFWRFVDGLEQGLLQLTNVSAYVGEILALFLLLLLALLLLVLFIHFRMFLFGYSVMIGYLLMASLYHPSQNFALQGLVIAGCGMLSIFLKNNSFQGRAQLKLLTSGIIIISVAFVAAHALPSSTLRNSLTILTGNLRNSLNETGFYDFVGSQGTASVSRMGYSEDDSQLGGPLLDDNAQVFTALQSTSHYWRVESKDFYSGAGWFASEDLEDNSYDDSNYLEVADENYQQSFTPAETIQVSYDAVTSYLALPYGDNQINFTNSYNEYLYDDETRKIDLLNSAEPISATITWQNLDYTNEDLTSVLTLTPTNSALDYLQVPDTLPSRVAELAQEITADVDGLYNRVSAVEDYLKNSSTFRYSKVDASVLEEGQDYVDQFLFESQVGYCDNFSSSMVILLRTLGIPARWVKGFAPGSSSRQGEQYLYTVTNNNAHSWVEVYFSGYGWLPFEPTPRFANPDRPTVTEEAEETPVSSSEATMSSSSSSAQTTATSSSSQETTTSSNQDDSSTTGQSVELAYLILGGLVALVVAWLLHSNWLLLRLRFVINGAEGLLKGYPLILQKAEKILARQPSETLENYAQRLVAEKNISGFVELTELYESALYSGTATATTAETRQLLWRLARMLTRYKKYQGRSGS